jgi:hypothetical protein
VDVNDMKKSHLRFLIGMTVFVFFIWGFLANLNKTRIFVLLPLSQSADWTNRVETGIKQGLINNRRPVAVTYYYMNMDQQHSEQQLRVAVASAMRAIKKAKPDILISVDDESNALVTSKIEVPQRPPVVFTSMLQSPSFYGYSPATRATGVIESMPTGGIIEILNMLKPQTSLKVAVIGINDLTGQSEMQLIQATDWGRHVLGPVLLADNFSAWQNFIQGPASKADILIVLTTDLLKKDIDGDYVSEKELVAWTQSNAKPFSLGVRLSYVRYGGGLAVAMPGSVFGRRAIEMSLKWLESGVDAPPPPIDKPSDFDVAMRTSILNQRGLVLPNVYRELARSSGSIYP